jgi:uncharacterized protein
MNLIRYPCSSLSKKVEGRARGDGERGIFVREFIRRSELIAVWGGKTMNLEELLQVPPEIRKRSVQVDEDFYMVSAVESQGDWVNHSCEPNAGIRGQISLVAMRNIAPGEEVTFDYAMTDSSEYKE